MMLTTRGSILRLLMWQWRYVTFFAICATIATVAHHYFVMPWLKLPTLPLAVVGAALGIFVSFRTNSAYDRWWEGRKLWGRLINSSRMLASQALTFARDGGAPDARAVEIVRRHVAYVHTLRILLREQKLVADSELERLTKVGGVPELDDIAALARQSNPTHALLHRQMEQLVEISEDGKMDAFRLQAATETLRQLLDIQGGCERIKKTPLPRGYGFIASRLILMYAILLPFALVADLGWLTIPISVFVLLAFALISEAGRVIEDPFSTFWNGLPLQALSMTIEVNLRERLGDEGLPKIPGPDARGVLM